MRITVEGLPCARRQIFSAGGCHHDAGADQRPGLEPMHGLELRQIQLAANRRKIDCLAPRHAHRAAGVGEYPDHLQPGLRVELAAAVLSEQRKCQHLQRIADENRGPFVEGFVSCRPATPQVVVIHGRQVVMHEGVAMDQLHRGGGRI